ncbi:MAG: His-Xaa-Ser system radical SAM maturase HxsC [Deltaproteobacteria bacterium]|nr:His-Xaa-Ser system radical SAM maturase HxsC [Deltaproteobacteria bacterium]
MLKLGGRGVRPLSPASAGSFVGRITEDADRPPGDRGREILLAKQRHDVLPAGFRAYLVTQPAASYPQGDVYALGAAFDYLGEGDVVRIDPGGHAIAALYRRHSPHNSFLVTERCDNYCVMCSQPPKERDDSWLVDELEQVIPLASPETKEIGFTGGEPSLLGPRLVSLVERMRVYLPHTAVHILSNGRGFKDAALAQALAAVRHPDLMVGIPLYSDVSNEHDFVVQARGAFDETIRGILNLKHHGVRVELRFVIHEATYRALPTFAEFVARNLLFVDHVALMGLEQMGFARANLGAIWIDPLDYQRELGLAVDTLARAGLEVSIYNHQLCVLSPSLHSFARASISDWKNVYLDECDTCAARQTCGGFFASSTERRSRGIAPIGR